MQHVFEDSKLTFTAEIKRGKAKSQEVDIKFEQVGGATKLADGKCKLGKKDKSAAYEVTLPKVAEGEESYTFKYHMESDGESYPGAEFTVWPRGLTVTCFDKDKETDPLPGSLLLVSQAEAPEIRCRANDKGVVDLKLLKAAPVTVTAISPYSLTKWKEGKDKGPKREAVIEKAKYKAAFFSHTPASDPLKQWINLTAPKSPSDPKDQGSLVTIEVGAVGDKEKQPDQRTARPGDKIHVQVKFDSANSKRNDPKPGLTVAGVKVQAESDKVTFKGVVTLGEGGTGKFQVELGLAGLDKCEIKIGVTEACEDVDPPLKFENWRKLWYQVTRPAGLAAPDMARMVGALAEIGVLYEKHGDDVQIPLDEGPSGRLNWFPGEWIGVANKALNIGDHNKGEYHKKFKDTKTPWQVHVLGCHTQYDTQVSGTVKSFIDLEVDKSTKCHWPGGPVGVDVYVGPGCFPKWLADGKAALISGSWVEVGGTGSGQITMAECKWDLPTNLGWVFVKLPAAAKALTDADKKVKLNLEFYNAAGPYLGEADGTSGWLQLIVFKAGANVVNDVMAHELGHTLNGTANVKPPGFDKEKHPRVYTGNGHQGSHCADGMSDGNYNAGKGKKGSDYEANFGGKAECTCIMFGENGEGSSCTGKYCASCKPWFKAEPLTSLHASGGKAMSKTVAKKEDTALKG
ncbi:MAG: hypothetical protein AB7N76_05365 [Planctomycetota bacterium]